MRFGCIFLIAILLFSFNSCEFAPSDSENEIAGSVIAVTGDTAAILAVEEYEEQGAAVSVYTAVSDVVIAVENGKADFAIIDDFDYIAYSDAERNIELVEKCGYELRYCVYFKKSSKALCEEFDTAINELKNNGVIDEIVRCHCVGEEYYGSYSTEEKGTVTMLCDTIADNRVYYDEEGNLVGTDVDIAREICSNLGYTLKIKTADFEELFIKLEKGEGDFILSATEMTDERAEKYLCSEAYLTLNFNLIKRKTS